MQWFRDVFGHDEVRRDFEANRARFRVEDGGRTLVSLSNGRRFHVGGFECASVGELEEQLAALPAPPGDLGGLTFENITGMVQAYISDRKLAGSVFQVASQFNCLEMVGPRVTPEHGVTMYCKDKTQGPACALACPAGTIFRNYFVNGGGQGGASGCQIDNLRDVAKVVGPTRYWTMSNGYSLPARDGAIGLLSKRLKSDAKLYQASKTALRVGIHWETSVHHHKKLGAPGAPQHTVCQVFCSAVPVAYAKSTRSTDWATFAQLVLEGAYEATLAAARVLARKRKARVKVFLTCLGGGAFGNRRSWIFSAIQNAINRNRDAPLDVRLLHYSAIPSACKAIRVRKRAARAAPGKDEANTSAGASSLAKPKK